jgi:hypothetical protein
LIFYLSIFCYYEKTVKLITPIIHRILYTGVGSYRSNNEYTDKEFLDIMNKEFTRNMWKYNLMKFFNIHSYELKFENFNLPNDFINFTLNYSVQ